jgi:hypothetical protein
MNLNKTHKELIVRKIMADIPMIDYAAQAQSILQAKAIEKMPAEVRAVYDNPDMRHWLATRYASNHTHLSGSYIFWQCKKGAGDWLYVVRCGHNDDPEDRELVAEVHDQIYELAKAAEEQWKARRSMEDKLRMMFYDIRTLKQAKTLLEKELHKYLPEEPPKEPKPAQASTALVPYVVAGLREMGWPKDKGEAA